MMKQQAKDKTHHLNSLFGSIWEEIYQVFRWALALLLLDSPQVFLHCHSGCLPCLFILCSLSENQGAAQALWPERGSLAVIRSIARVISQFQRSTKVPAWLLYYVSSLMGLKTGICYQGNATKWTVTPPVMASVLPTPFPWLVSLGSY